MVAKSHARIEESRSISRLIEMHKFGDLRPKTEERSLFGYSLQFPKRISTDKEHY